MNWIILLGLLLSGYSFAQNDSRIDALTKRIEELERQQEELILNDNESAKPVSSFLSDKLTLGGFFESAVTTIDGPDTRFQSMFSGSTMGLNLSAQFGEKLRFVNQTLTILAYPLLNPNNHPTAVTGHTTREFGDPIFAATVTIGYIETPIFKNSTLQAGVGYVPFGYAAQQRELVLFIRRGGPQVLRTRNLIQPLWSGFHLSGTSNSRNVGYNVYTMNSLDKSNTMGIGGRGWVNAMDDRLKMGVSTQVMKFGGHTSEIVGTDIRLDSEHFIITSEYVNHMTGEGENPWSAYFEPAVKLLDGEVLLFVFTDYSEDRLNKLSASALDPVTRWENGIGVNWLPTSNTRFRMTASREDYRGSGSTIQGQNRDFWYLDLSAGIAF
jgi:hypothetical protein